MSRLRPPLGPQDHVQGNPDASIELVEYGDYECPYCGRAYRVVKALQEARGDADLLDHAEILGLDVQRFARDLDLDKVAERVRADFLSGARSGVNGTPTFFVNGERYDGSWEPDVFLQYLRDLLAEQAPAEPL